MWDHGGATPCCDLGARSRTIASFDPKLIFEESNPEAVLAALHEASHQLQLPVEVDRQLYELTAASLEAACIVRRLRLLFDEPT